MGFTMDSALPCCTTKERICTTAIMGVIKMKKLPSLKIIAILAVILCIYFSVSIFAEKDASQEFDKIEED
jgi:hypothetical protein